MSAGAIKNRVEWVDQARGIAIVMMIIFHIGFDLSYTGNFEVNTSQGLWHLLARMTQWIFLLTVGISLFLSHSKKPAYFVYRQFKRALILFLIAMSLTLVTVFIIPRDFIMFGILHLISISILVGAVLVRYPYTAAILAAIAALLFFSTGETSNANELLLIFGFYPAGYRTLDYFPIIPWISLPLLGITIANLLNRFHFFHYTKKATLLGNVGRKSLIIYLVHQPIILGVLWLIF